VRKAAYLGLYSLRQEVALLTFQEHRRIALCGGCCVLMAALLLNAPALTAVDSLPTRLTDDAFWRLISDFSEESGPYPSENLTSNELYFQHVIPTLKRITKPGGVYLGVGPEQNFTYIAALEPKMAFIIDIRRQNMLEILLYKALFEMAPDRADFVALLFSRKRPAGLDGRSTAATLFDAYGKLRADPDVFKQNLKNIQDVLLQKHGFGLSIDDLSGIEHVYQQFFTLGPDTSYYGNQLPTYRALMTATDTEGLAIPGTARSFLATEDNFRFVRQMHQRNVIVPLVGDFGGPKTIRSVAQFLRDHDAKVEAFYISNVDAYLMPSFSSMPNGGAANFYASAAELPVNATSPFIRACPSADGLPIPRARFVSKLVSIADRIAAFNNGNIKVPTDIGPCTLDPTDLVRH